jgi:predicted DNA-binding protein with PD1-like motif
MKVIIKDNRRYIFRFDKGEEVFVKLLEFAAQENISAASFNAIGACSEIELGYFNVNLKDYRKKPFYEELEMISLIGNLSVAEGKLVAHSHGMFGRTDFTTIGGHVFKAVVSVTCEMFLIKLDGQMNRKLDEATNLKLLD